MTAIEGRVGERLHVCENAWGKEEEKRERGLQSCVSQFVFMYM